MICAVAMAARHFRRLSVTKDGSSLHYVLRPCRTWSHSLTMATEFVAASAILVLVTIVNDWPIDQGITRVMHNLPGYTYPTRVSKSL